MFFHIKLFKIMKMNKLKKLLHMNLGALLFRDNTLELCSEKMVFHAGNSSKKSQSHGEHRVLLKEDIYQDN